jgi:hypothetical protein
MRPQSATIPLAILLVLGGAAPGLMAQGVPPPPITTQEDDLLPVALFDQRTLHAPPPLDASMVSVKAFVAWASASVPAEREDARRALAQAASKPGVSNAVAAHLCHLSRQALKSDHTLALVVLALLGELRNTGPGFRCLVDIAWTALPTEGTFNEELGGLIEVESLATVEAKAIDGVAYVRTAAGDAEVMRAIASHPSRIVRAEAIDAYLWNHGDTPQAKDRIRALTRDHGEEVFLDRIRREDGEGAATFDEKLRAFVAAHPELMPAEDETGGANPPKDEQPGTTVPPPIAGFVFGPTCGFTAPACNGTCGQGLSCVTERDAGCVCVTNDTPR